MLLRIFAAPLLHASSPPSARPTNLEAPSYRCVPLIPRSQKVLLSASKAAEKAAKAAKAMERAKQAPAPSQHTSSHLLLLLNQMSVPPAPPHITSFLPVNGYSPYPPFPSCLSSLKQSFPH